MSIINCFIYAVVNIPQKSSSRILYKTCRTEASCKQGINTSIITVLVFTLPMKYAIFVNQSQSLKLYFKDKYLHMYNISIYMYIN